MSPTGPTSTRTTASTLVIDGTLADPSELGGKGAALARLVAWGLPVPVTGAVTAGATRMLVDHPMVHPVIERLRSGRSVSKTEIDQAFLDVPLPDGLGDAVIDLARTIGGDRRLAIRSSATVEDLAHLSFAGQYRSLLDIDPHDPDEVLRAVRLVVASLWHPAPFAYRRMMGVPDDDIGMCVLMMPMIPASLAGVVFTVAPGDDAAARVEFVHGLADDLVSGRVTPDARVLSRAGLCSGTPAAEDDEADRVAAAAARLALEVEERAGRPQDVEWAWDESRVWLVQARPITTLTGTSDEFDAPPDVLRKLELTTVSIGETMPGVLAPLLWDVNRHLVEEAFRSLFDRLGTLRDDIDDTGPLVWRVRGRAAMDVARLHDLSVELPGATSDDLDRQMFGVSNGDVGPAPSRMRGGRRRSIAHDVRVSAIRSRAVLDADVACRVAASLDAPPCSGVEAMRDEELIARHRHVLDLGTRAMAAELAVAADAVATYARLEHLLGRRFPAAETRRIATALTSGAAIAVDPSPAASAALFAGPTWIEAGSTLGQPSARQPSVEIDRAGTTVAVREVLDREAGTPGTSLPRQLWFRSVRRAAVEAVEQLHRRERTKAAVLRLGGEVRLIHREVGSRLAARGLLASAGDLELLTVHELHRTVLAGKAPPPEVLRDRRHHLRAHQCEPPLPTRFSGVPPIDRFDDAPADRIDGWAASPGRYTGVGRVVAEPTDPFIDGEVLVAAATDPSWSPLFARAGAIVLERGGPLSHAAILARELGVPAVLNVPHATTRLGGRTLSVDGDLGVVVVVEPDRAHGADR